MKAGQFHAGFAGSIGEIHAGFIASIGDIRATWTRVLLSRSRQQQWRNAMVPV